MKRIIYLVVFSFVLFTFGYGIKPYNERMDDFTARIEWSIEFVTNYIAPWYFPDEVKKPLTGIKYHYTLYYDRNNKRPFDRLMWFWEGAFIKDDFLYTRGMCSNNNTVYTGGPSEGTIFTGEIRGGMSFGGKYRPDKTKIWITNKYIQLPDGNKMVMDYSEGDAPPGSRIDFEVIVKGNKTMPGVLELEGTRIRAMWVFEDVGELPPDFEEGTTGKPFYVVGPIVKPKGGPLEYIEKLIDITQSAFNLGWISKNDVYEGLNDKLVAAKENIKKGRSNYHTAINIVEAYKHLLDAQRGKAIEEQCYRMLYYDANELIGMLR